MSVNILTLDLGSSTGWAYFDGMRITSGTISFKPYRFEGGGMRFLRFRQWLDELPPFGAVYFEEVRRHLGTDAAHLYGGFLATLGAWCESGGVPYSGIPVGTIKKHATGSGRASKEDMIAAAKAKGFNPCDDNEADAIAIMDYILKATCYTQKY